MVAALPLMTSEAIREIQLLGVQYRPWQALAWTKQLLLPSRGMKCRASCGLKAVALYVVLVDVQTFHNAKEALELGCTT